MQFKIKSTYRPLRAMNVSDVSLFWRGGQAVCEGPKYFAYIWLHWPAFVHWIKRRELFIRDRLLSFYVFFTFKNYGHVDDKVTRSRRAECRIGNISHSDNTLTGKISLTLSGSPWSKPVLLLSASNSPALV